MQNRMNPVQTGQSVAEGTIDQAAMEVAPEGMPAAGQPPQGAGQSPTGQPGAPQSAGGTDAKKYVQMVQEHIYGAEEAAGSDEHGKKTFDSLVTMLKAGKDDLHKTIGQAANGIVDAVEKKTGPIDVGILQSVGVAAVAELLDLAQKAGLLEKIQQGDVIKATGEAFGQWMKAHPDRVDPKQLMSAIQNPQANEMIKEAGGIDPKRMQQRQPQGQTPAQPVAGAPAVQQSAPQPMGAGAPMGLLEDMNNG